MEEQTALSWDKLTRETQKDKKLAILLKALTTENEEMTEITEVELISDGGYKYAVFNILYEYLSKDISNVYIRLYFC